LANDVATLDDVDGKLAVLSTTARRQAERISLQILLATPAGIEPATNSLEGCCSNPLSYGAVASRGPAGATRAR
jgi:hypothetical protein